MPRAGASFLEAQAPQLTCILPRQVDAGYHHAQVARTPRSAADHHGRRCWRLADPVLVVVILAVSAVATALAASPIAPWRRRGDGIIGASNLPSTFLTTQLPLFRKSWWRCWKPARR